MEKTKKIEITITEEFELICKILPAGPVELLEMFVRNLTADAGCGPLDERQKAREYFQSVYFDPIGDNWQWLNELEDIHETVRETRSIQQDGLRSQLLLDWRCRYVHLI